MTGQSGEFFFEVAIVMKILGLQTKRRIYVIINIAHANGDRGFDE
jgi:hypothetical protein